LCGGLQLIAGSGTTAEGDEAANGADGAAKDAEGNYGVGVPGPLTRLFVIANRGVASLIQDLILVSITYLIFCFNFRKIRIFSARTALCVEIRVLVIETFLLVYLHRVNKPLVPFINP
jgi:hypothetical protein